MKKFYLIFFTGFLLLGSLFVCCKKETDPLILVTSENFISPMKGKMKVRFEIEAKSPKSTITKVEIKEYSTDFGYKILKDTSINEASTIFFFEYTTPVLSCNQEVKLTFTAYNNKNGKSASHLRYDYIFEDELLKEYSGYSMYILKSGKPDGFLIQSKQVVYSNAEISYGDFYSFQDSINLDPNILQRIWKSYSGLFFIKFNGFDYSKATYKSLTDSYLSGVRLPMVTNIEPDDIILIGFGQTPIGVIKVIAVYDEEGYLNDRYVFNVKFIE